MSRLPADHAIRTQALDVTHSVIVRAPAGSGKTTLLTQRFLALLARVEAPEEIVAITFTRKAAAEMRQRIVGALRSAAARDEQATPLASAALARDAARGWDLLQQPARLRVETIDAFAGGIAAALPLTSGLSGPGVILEDAAPLYRDAVRQLLADLEQDLPWRDALTAVLTHLDNDQRRFEKLLAGMLSRRDQWLRLLRGDTDGAALTATVTRLIVLELVRARDLFPAVLVGRLLPLVRYAGANLARHRPDSLGTRLADLDTLPPAALEALPDWIALADLLLTAAGGWRQRLTLDNGFPPRRQAADAEVRKGELLALLAELAAVPGLAAALAGLRRLPEPSLDPHHAALTGSLLRLLQAAAAYLEVVFVEQGVSDFTRVALAAERALGEPERPTDLSLALDHRIAHLLVDEFQDTSITQYELLLRLTAGWQPGDGRTLFLVGDPLQSIYRFREANVQLFEQVVRLGRFGTVPLQVLALSGNFRSQPALIDWLNAQFPRLNAPVDALQVRTVGYTPVTAEVAPTGAAGVFVHARRQDDAGAEIAALIAQRLAQDPQQNIAVLARSRAHVTGLAQQLRERGIAVRAGDVAGPAHSAVVRDLATLACALAHPADRIAWLALLRAPWCGLTLADLAILTEAEQTPPRAVVRDLLADEALQARLSAEGRQRVRRVRAALDGVSSGAGLLHEQVETTWLALGGPACLCSEQAGGEAEQFFDLLASLVAEYRTPTRAQLERGIARLRAQGAASEAPGVALLTIHKAKGLEFDVVIVPAIERRVSGDERRLLEWTEIVWPDNDTSLLFAPIPEPGEETNGERSWTSLIRRREQLEQLLELRRLLYVALTRARRELHLFGTLAAAAEPTSGTLLDVLWPAVAEAFAYAAEPAASATPSLPEAPRLLRLPADWSSPLPRSTPAPPELPLAATPVEYAWAGIAARQVGTIVHECLRRIAADGVEHWSPDRIAALRPGLVRQAQRLGLVGAAGDEAIAQALAALTGALADPRGRWILSGTHRQAAAEQRVTGLIDGRVSQAIIDRSFIAADETCWIIDYKTSTHAGGAIEAFIDSECERYRPQLDRYATLLSAMYAGPIRVGLYFPLLLNWREWPWRCADS
ncbi:MAG: UvrD-helicase domain-containing protein [Gammaproteobacteria bacterium]|nr:UvrD-helicase domain-containing protein [Gammaproteobacteria bacterium]